MSGTGLASGLGAVSWESEDSFADAADDTFTYRHQVRDAMVDVSGLVRPMQERGGVFQLAGQTDARILGPYGVGTFTTTLDLAGHGSATNGALTQTNLARLLAHAVGNYRGNTGGNVTTNSSGATDITSTDATLDSDTIFRVGVLGDGRANGQTTVSATGSSPWTLDVALPGTPTTADDIYAMQIITPMSSPASTLRLTSSGATSNNTLRFVLQTANYQFVCRGCACTGISISGLSPGETPRVTLNWATVAWDPVAQTFPNATAHADYMAVPCTGGSLFYNDVGTATRNVDIVRRFEVSIGHGMVPVIGQGGENAGQTVVGWCRTPALTTIRFAVEAEAATATPEWYDYFGTDPNALTAKHVMYTASVVDGSAVAMYFQQCYPSDRQPTQTEIDGVNYLDVELVATAVSASNEWRKAAWVLGLG